MSHFWIYEWIFTHCVCHPKLSFHMWQITWDFGGHYMYVTHSFKKVLNIPIFVAHTYEIHFSSKLSTLCLLMIHIPEGGATKVMDHLYIAQEGYMLYDMKDIWKWDIFPANVTWIMDRYIDVQVPKHDETAPCNHKAKFKTYLHN